MSVLSRIAPLTAPLLALAAGALAVLGFAPFDYSPLGMVALALFYQALSTGSPRAGFWRGWLFGVGLLGFGVFWIRISLNQFGNMDAWIANLMTALFIAAMAIYYGLLGWLVRRLAPGRARWISPVLLFPALYVLLEWLRGWLFTGFPWLNIGYTQLNMPLAGYAPVVGVYGVSLTVAVAAGLLWGLVHWRARARWLAAVGLVVLAAAGSLLQQVEWTSPIGKPFKATVLQANILPEVKWQPGEDVKIAQAYLELTRDHFDSDLIVWPETALPDFLDTLKKPLIDPLAQRAREEGVEIALGIPVIDRAQGRYYNGLLSIGSHEDLYFKRHLVPFGEFMPFKSWVGPIARWFEVPMSDFSRGTTQRPLLQVGEHLAGASICYEDAFPAEVAQALPQAQYLINVSNDAWFGHSLAPHQHLQIARMRALETGRDLVRATNTGVSAIIDAHGRVLGTLPLFERGGLSAMVQPRTGTTPYVRVGNWLVISLAILWVLLVFFLRGEPRDPQDEPAS